MNFVIQTEYDAGLVLFYIPSTSSVPRLSRLALSPTLVTVNTAKAMAMAMVVTGDDVGLVRGDS